MWLTKIIGKSLELPAEEAASTTIIPCLVRQASNALERRPLLQGPMSILQCRYAVSMLNPSP